MERGVVVRSYSLGVNPASSRKLTVVRYWRTKKTARRRFDGVDLASNLKVSSRSAPALG